MIEKCNDQEIIEKYIAKDYPKCLYLYLDLKQYGVKSKSVATFVQSQKGMIQAVYLKYYNCLHVYSKENDFDLDEFYSFFDSSTYSMIYCEKTTAYYIWNKWFSSQSKDFDITPGWVARIRQVDMKAQNVIQVADDNDFPQIVMLIHEDEDIGRSYNLEELSEQLKERALDGYTRNFVIHEAEKVIAHACTNAEIDDIAVVAELVVDKEYRRKGYASQIWRFICKQLLDEGKEVYSFYYSTESRSLHRKIGFEEVCEWAKIVKNT